MNKVKTELTSIDWWKAAGIRAVKTFAQTMLLSLTMGVGLFDMEWVSAVSISTGSAVASLITALAGLPEVETEGG